MKKRKNSVKHIFNKMFFRTSTELFKGRGRRHVQFNYITCFLMYYCDIVKKKWLLKIFYISQIVNSKPTRASISKLLASRASLSVETLFLSFDCIYPITNSLIVSGEDSCLDFKRKVKK